MASAAAMVLRSTPRSSRYANKDAGQGDAKPPLKPPAPVSRAYRTQEFVQLTLRR